VIELNGKYNSAKVFTDNVEATAQGQIIELCNQEFSQGSKIRIMPDTHAGAGCTIGTTMTIADKVVPNLVGVDIGCGMAVAEINITGDINYDQLDSVVRKHVPSGFSVRPKPHEYLGHLDYLLDNVVAPFNRDRAEKSIGTLGGGNHFIELNRGDDGKVYLVIHSGSRNLGKQIAEHYQDKAYDELTDVSHERQEIIDRLTAEGRQREISEAISSLSKPKVSRQLAYLQGQSFKDYMNDMRIAQRYAWVSREAMIAEIVKNMGWSLVEGESFTTVHNYIDLETMILRKGAISAQKDEKVIIPINMRDGSIIAYGKGNPDWNFSGPHGAGRLMSRSKAKQAVAMADFEETMKGVWSTSVVESTLDESPFAYKPMEEILSNVTDSVDVSKIIKPLYNFKAN
jgi:tRNA-splicing ligase RtcB